MLTLDQLLDDAPAGYLAFSDDGQLLLVNNTLARMLGYESSELVGSRLERILTVGSRIFYQTHWFPMLRLHGRADEIFLSLCARNGEEIGTLVNAVRREDDGKPSYHCVLLRVRERQKYEEELLRARRAAEEANRELRAQKADLEHANRQLEKQAHELEAQQEQLLEQSQRLQSYSEQLAATNEELAVANEQLLERQEELEQARAQAEDANKAKSTFLAVMSHELRTPLNAIAGYAELIDMGIHGPVTDEQRESLDRIMRSQRHLLRLINDVLNLARIEAGRVDYRIEDVSLPDIVAETTPLVEPQLTQRNITLRTNISDEHVRADREKLQQILINLLSNAIKFTPEGGEISIIAVQQPDRNTIGLDVTDNGIGIAPDKLDSVFEPFVQVGTTRREGTGLGLAISRDLAHGMGGDLRVRSTLEQGSTFTILLQRAAHAD